MSVRVRSDAEVVLVSGGTRAQMRPFVPIWFVIDIKRYVGAALHSAGDVSDKVNIQVRIGIQSPSAKYN